MCKKTHEKDVVGIVTFDLIGLLSTNHIIAYITIAYTGVCEETFDINRKIAQTTPHCRKVEPTTNGKLRRLSGRFQTLIWRPGEKVQNLESPGLSGRADSTVGVFQDLHEARGKLIAVGSKGKKGKKKGKKSGKASRIVIDAIHMSSEGK